MDSKGEIKVAELVAVCVKAAEKACNTIRCIQESGDLLAVEKGDGRDSVTGRRIADLQTEADRQSERIVFSVLRKYLGDVKIVGEEESSGLSATEESDGNTARSNSIEALSESTFDKVKKRVLESSGSGNFSVKISDLTIFVDPLDGTSQFIGGHLHCVSVLIGIALKGSSFAGIIARPFPDSDHPNWCMYGIVGVGTFIDHSRINHSDSLNRSHIVIATSPNRSTHLLDKFIEKVPARVMKEGGAGWKCWLVASGIADCYLYTRPGTKKWDILAGDAIISALGGLVTDACGHHFQYEISDNSAYNNSWGLVATLDPRLHRDRIVPACHQILVDAASDHGNKEWPCNLVVPTVNTT